MAESRRLSTWDDVCSEAKLGQRLSLRGGSAGSAEQGGWSSSGAAAGGTVMDFEADFMVD